MDINKKTPVRTGDGDVMHLHAYRERFGCYHRQ
jgi:hypothetical protein